MKLKYSRIGLAIVVTVFALLWVTRVPDPNTSTVSNSKISPAEMPGLTTNSGHPPKGPNIDESAAIEFTKRSAQENALTLETAIESFSRKIEADQDLSAEELGVAARIIDRLREHAEFKASVTSTY